MPKPSRTVGETKLKILAIICHNELHGIDSYGYNVWRNLKKRFHSYIDERDLRNVYRYLRDLDNAGLVKKGTKICQERPKTSTIRPDRQGKRTEAEVQ